MFDLSEVKAFDIVPQGTHTATVTKVEFKESKSGSEYLNLTLKTDSGNVFVIMNINHPKEEVKNIALAELKRLLTAAKFSTLKFESKEQLAEALENARFNITVKHKTDDYGTKAVVSGYKECNVPADASVIPF